MKMTSKILNYFFLAGYPVEMDDNQITSNKVLVIFLRNDFNIL